jgi:hypothetical protein
VVIESGFVVKKNHLPKRKYYAIVIRILAEIFLALNIISHFKVSPKE